MRLPTAVDATNGILTLAAYRGFDDPSYLNLSKAMPFEASAYAAVIKTGERLIIEDLRDSGLLAGAPSKEKIKEVLLGAEVRAVTAMPLMAGTGNLLGIIAIHFAKPYRPNERELQLMDLLSRQAADYLQRKQAEETEKTLLRELQHRNGNLLAVIQAIADKSFSGSDIAEARQAFESRLQAGPGAFQPAANKVQLEHRGRRRHSAWRACNVSKSHPDKRKRR